MITIADRVDRVTARIEDACTRAGRSVDDVTLVAVSKTFPVSAILEAIRAGVHHFGENKAQDFAAKFDEIAVTDAGPIYWHFVGHLQRNKAKLVVGRSDLFHALDSARLAAAIQKIGVENEQTVDCLAQLNVSDEPAKFGLSPDELPAFLDEIGGMDRIRLRGLMTLAEYTDDTRRLSAQFKLLRKSKVVLDASGHQDADILSMGMSNDFELAIEQGATHVRVGSAIFGPRN